MANIGKYLLAAAIGAALASVCFVAVRCTDTPNDNIIRDTLVVHDTIRYETPIAKVVHTSDTVLVYCRDTTIVRDSVFVKIPMETKVYADTTYKAQVTGYRATLDWIEVYPTTTTITETITKTVPKKTRWGIGVQVGYGAALHNKQVVLSPYLGVGVSYNIFSW